MSFQPLSLSLKKKTGGGRVSGSDVWMTDISHAQSGCRWSMVGTLRRYHTSGLLVWQGIGFGCQRSGRYGDTIRCRCVVRRHWAWLPVGTLRRYHPSGSLYMLPSSCGHVHYGEVAARRAARCNIRGTHLGLAAAALRSGHTGCDAADRRTVIGADDSARPVVSHMLDIPLAANTGPPPSSYRFRATQSFLRLTEEELTLLRGVFHLAEVCHREFLATNIVSATEAVTHGATPPRRKFRRWFLDPG